MSGKRSRFVFFFSFSFYRDLDVCGALFLEGLDGGLDRAARGEHRVEDEDERRLRDEFLAQLVVIVDGLETRFVAVEAEMPDARRRQDVERALHHAETRTEDGHEGNVMVRNRVALARTNGRLDLDLCCGYVAEGLVDQQRRDLVDQLTKQLVVRRGLSKQGQLVLDEGMLRDVGAHDVHVCVWRVFSVSCVCVLCVLLAATNEEGKEDEARTKRTKQGQSKDEEDRSAPVLLLFCASARQKEKRKRKKKLEKTSKNKSRRCLPSAFHAQSNTTSSIHRSDAPPAASSPSPQPHKHPRNETKKPRNGLQNCCRSSLSCSLSCPFVLDFRALTPCCWRPVSSLFGPPRAARRRL